LISEGLARFRTLEQTVGIGGNLSSIVDLNSCIAVFNFEKVAQDLLEGLLVELVFVFVVSVLKAFEH
jgi:hypothetical protein